MTSLILNDSVKNLANNRSVAYKQFQALEKKFNRHPMHAVQYKAAMQEYIDRGDVEVASHHPSLRGGYFLPHSAVIREDHLSTKVRIVFNGSSKAANQLSLNDCQTAGPKTQQDILKILMGFRWHPVAITGDVKKMFLSLKVAPQDRDFLRFFWRNNQKEPIKEYRHSSLPFGLKISPFLAQQTLIMHATKFEQSHPQEAALVINRRYVDDLVSSVPTEKAAVNIIHNIQAIMATGGFELKKWVSNSAPVMQSLAPEDRLPIKTLTFNDSAEELEAVGALGVQWQVAEDTLSIKIPATQMQTNLTKRQIASIIASIFDPLMLLAPFTITGKRVLQKVWQLHGEAAEQAKQQGTSPQDILRLRSKQWDQQVPSPLAQEFEQWRQQLQSLNDFRIQRCLVDKDAAINNRQLHVFCDASPFAFGCAAYVRTEYADGRTTVNLAAAKAKVAQADISGNMPRLELLGALTAAQLAWHLQQSLTDINAQFSVLFWTDSSVALQWIQGTPTRWQQWVANRVISITEHHPGSAWRHVPGKENPADLCSRGISAQDCASNQLWLHGPPWLQQAQDQWPNRQFQLSEQELHQVQLEQKRQFQNSEHEQQPGELKEPPQHQHLQVHLLQADNAAAPQSQDKSTILLKILPKFSNLQRLLHALCLFRLKEKGRGLPEVTYGDRAEMLLDLIRAVQSSVYKEVYTKLLTGEKYSKKWDHQDMNVFMDGSNLLKAPGRFPDNSTTAEAPLLLPHNHHLTKLIIRDIHHSFKHSGPEWVLHHFRLRFWCRKARKSIKDILAACPLCTRFRGRHIQQVMAPLPQFRLEDQPRPFRFTGIDFAGPLMAHEKDGTEHKVWILLCTCLQMRAVHLELVTGMDTETLIAALRRFFARRGRPSCMYSDNGRSFHLAAKELTALNKVLESKQLPPPLRAEAIQWEFQLPSSSWRGGIFERLVRSVKETLRTSLFREKLSQDEVHTALLETEMIVNHRPLCQVSDDPSDPLPVTPAMLLQGYHSTEEPQPGALVELKPEGLVRKWKKRLRLQSVLHERFIKDYISSLRPRHKWHQVTDKLKVGTLVFVDEPCKRLMWPLAKVEALHKGKDNVIRSVTLRDKHGIKKRAVQKLVPLEFSDAHD